MMCDKICEVILMASNLDIDDGLLREAQRVGRHRTKKATVTEALQEYIQRRQQLSILDMFGKVDYEHDYDHKQQRKRQ